MSRTWNFVNFPNAKWSKTVCVQVTQLFSRWRIMNSIFFAKKQSVVNNILCIILQWENNFSNHLARRPNMLKLILLSRITTLKSTYNNQRRPPHGASYTLRVWFITRILLEASSNISRRRKRRSIDAQKEKQQQTGSSWLSLLDIHRSRIEDMYRLSRCPWAGSVSSV